MYLKKAIVVPVLLYFYKALYLKGKYYIYERFILKNYVILTCADESGALILLLLT